MVFFSFYVLYFIIDFDERESFLFPGFLTEVQQKKFPVSFKNIFFLLWQLR